MASQEPLEKTLKSPHVSADVEIEQGRLDEIQPELDSDEKEQTGYDYESEHSPFAEGMWLAISNIAPLMGEPPSTGRRA